MKQTQSHDEQTELRRAAERLLAWGFPPGAIAKQLGCSQTWVSSLEQQRAAQHEDMLDTSRLIPDL